jgi:hypothetical protein
VRHLVGLSQTSERHLFGEFGVQHLVRILPDDVIEQRCADEGRMHGVAADVPTLPSTVQGHGLGQNLDHRLGRVVACKTFIHEQDLRRADVALALGADLPMLVIYSTYHDRIYAALPAED